MTYCINYNLQLFYKNMMKVYVFYFLSTSLLLVLYELNIEESYIFFIYITFILWYFNIISLEKILLLSILGYFLYENGVIHSIQQKLNNKYIEYVKSVHENTGIILADFTASQASLKHDQDALNKNFDSQ